MILCPLTCGNVAYICQRCQHLQMIGILWLTRRGRPVAHMRPFPRPCRPSALECADELWHEQPRPVLRAAGAPGTPRGRVDAGGIRAADRLRPGADLPDRERQAPA